MQLTEHIAAAYAAAQDLHHHTAAIAGALQGAAPITWRDYLMLQEASTTAWHGIAHLARIEDVRLRAEVLPDMERAAAPSIDYFPPEVVEQARRARAATRLSAKINQAREELATPAADPSARRAPATPDRMPADAADATAAPPASPAPVPAAALPATDTAVSAPFRAPQSLR